MNPEYEHKVPQRLEDLHLDEDRAFINPWDEPTSSSVASTPPATDGAPGVQTPNAVLQSQPELAPQPMAAALPIATQTKQPSKVKAIWFSAIAALLIGVVTSGALVYHTYNLNHISDHDLTSTNFGNSTFLKPKQWKLKGEPTSGKVAYGDTLGQDGKSTALMTVAEMSMNGMSLASMSSEDIRELRTSTDEQMTETTIHDMLIKNGTCKDVSNIKKTVGTRSSDTIADIIKINIDCTREDFVATASLDIAAGNDGYMHFIVLMSTNDGWSKNQKVYTKILESIQPRGSVAARSSSGSSPLAIFGDSTSSLQSQNQ